MQAGILCIDIGSSSLKAALISENGYEICRSQVKLPTLPVRYGAFDPLCWYQALLKVCKELFLKQVIRPRGIVISGHGPSLVPIDRHGQNTAPLIIWSGPRGTTIEGNPSLFLPRVVDWQEQFPELAERTDQLIPCPDYLVGLLTGVWRSTIAHEAYRPWYWDPLQIKQYGIKAELLPSPISMLDVAGILINQDVIALGIAKGVPVYSGGADFLMSLLGTATITPGIICDRAGSSEGINVCLDRPLQGLNLRTLPGTLPGTWNLAAIVPASGMLFEWFRQVTGQKQKTYQEILDAIIPSTPSVDGPYFFPDPGMTGMFANGAFIGLEATHGPADLSRAIVECLAFQVLRAKKRLEQHIGAFETIRMCGGQARNIAWCQLKADITGLNIDCPRVVDAELLGGAILAFTALADYPSLSDAAHSMVQIETRYLPNLHRHQQYQVLFEKWDEKSKSINCH